MASSSPMKLNFNLLPSLERMALIKTAIALWNKNDIYFLSKLVIKTHPQSFFLFELVESSEWKKIESEVLEKIQQLNQPRPLKDKIYCFIKPIGLEIFQFIKYHLDLYDGCIRSIQFIIEKECFEEEVSQTLINPDELYWTPQGTINRKKTAEALIRDEKLDIKKRYILACHYCLEKEIFELWNRICNCSEIHNYEVHINCYCLVRQWTSHVKGKIMNSQTYEQLICDSIENVNLEAAKYFFTKLNTRQRNNLLRNFDSRVMYTDHTVNKTAQFNMVPFFLSELDEDQETELIQKDPMLFLNLVLNWPWQPLFMEVAKRGCDFLNMYESHIVLHEIADLIIRGYKDYDYRVLLRDFWQRIPNTHKRFVVEQFPDYGVLSDELLAKLLQIKDFENFYLILKEATADECINIFRGKNSCNINLLYEEEALHAKPFIHQVFMSSPSKDVVQFSKEFKECILRHRLEEEIERDKETWNKLFEFVNDELIHNNKRTLEDEEESIVTKRLMVTESDDL